MYHNVAQFLFQWLLLCSWSLARHDCCGSDVSPGLAVGALLQLVPNRGSISIGRSMRADSITATHGSSSHDHERRKLKRTNHDDICSCQIEAILQRERGVQFVLGSDETGRGAIAGPLVAATCCVLIPDLQSAIENKSFVPIQGVNDSKLLTEQEKWNIYDAIQARPHEYAWKSATISPNQIDESNIQQANMEGLRQSIEGLVHSYGLSPTDSYAIVDGKKSPKLSPELNGVLKCRPWVRGDIEVYTVALASIVAWVTFEKIMTEQAHAQFPMYNFKENKGYPSQAHVQSIHEYGPCEWHRQSVKPVKKRNSST